ncbi:PREDICTED: uncharacterized protein LOC104785299 [Camelina sativa]|uniref:Uncharacterized protein LOC104785299 n=1 Tax=Camelina sativa TaxID=90675 RepID=A0ABM0Z0N5_CAMSA|nr:PREDICTED: uncharacterized protein LOC104785299 [Camelina sativa]
MDTALTSETGCALMAEKGFTVDPFLVEALQNPRHRLTILRMELDVQKFLQNPDEQQFEFQYFPTSYLRLAAHRVANHYGLVTSVRDVGADGNMSRILVTKSTDSRFPAVRLSEIPAKQSETGKFEHMKVAIKTRPSKGSGMEGGDLGKQGGLPRSVEEKKEDYDRARERIFNGLANLNCNDSPSETNPWKVNCSPIRDDENQVLKSGNLEAEKNHFPRESIPASRIAVLRDREKDRYDPDYDRSYQRYIRNLPVDQNFCLPHFNIQNIGAPCYDMGYSGYSQNTSAPTSLNLGQHSVMSPYVTTGLNQPSMNAAMYMQWPNAAAVMYTHSYEHFRNAPLQGQFYPHPQPLSFDYMQNR